MEIRRIWVSNEPQVYDCTDFPYSQQFFIVERDIERRYRGNVSHSVDIAYGVTSLKQEQVSAKRLTVIGIESRSLGNREQSSLR